MSASYKPVKQQFPPLEFEFDTFNGDGSSITIKATAKHLLGYQFSALDDNLVGVVKEELDPTGGLQARRAAIKLGKVLISAEPLDAETLESVGGDLAKFCELPGNEEFAFQGWNNYVLALRSAYSKSRPENGGESDDGGVGGQAGE